MLRKIVKIDPKKCNACGACVNACHEKAIEIIGGHAQLIRDDFCDGLGDCLPACPTGAITIEMREAPDYDRAAVEAHNATASPVAHHCPGIQARELQLPHKCVSHNHPEDVRSSTAVSSALAQWPVQIKLVPVKAPFYANADLLIAADCTAYTYANFHSDFMRGRVTIIGCPKLDGCDYTEKLTEIFSSNVIKSVTLTRMIVPCCGGLERAIRQALENAGYDIPLNVVTFALDGKILDN